ncbi:SRPBCC family protein [Streptomyces sp. NBC_00190]|uniref:SRPBCC family protein n=1 Tax=unclassified Streptomyces TaxID=2593676 RepID=UPI002E2E13DF|nr:SRPBCC family protein [Streptomyces sp. NBC_00190]WSZ38123.1 SRPBCC family protein [Streptomyces sp. NBC_00868]
MATSTRANAQESETSGLDQLVKELSGYLSAQADQLAEKATDKLGDLTDQLYDVAENGGKLSDIAGIGGRLAQGDSPLKAVAGQTLGNLKDKVADTASQVFGKGRGRKSGGKVVNIVEALDIGLPLRTTYDHWCQYENFSSFAKGVRDVSRDDETNSDWKVKVGPSTRSWKATVQEQVPDERIVWTSSGAKGTTRGCVSFHELAPSLTRIVIVVEYNPAGLFEKTGNLWRAQGRRLRLDLKNFLRYVTLTTDEPEGWRGEIQDGEVVRTHEEALDDEEAAEGEDEQGEDEDQYEDAEDGEEEEAYEDEDEDADADADQPEDAEAETEDDTYDTDEPDAEEGEDEEVDEGEGEYEEEAEEPRPRRRRRQAA